MYNVTAILGNYLGKSINFAVTIPSHFKWSVSSINIPYTAVTYRNWKVRSNLFAFVNWFLVNPHGEAAIVTDEAAIKIVANRS